MANSGPNTNGSQFFVISGPDGTQLPPQYSLFGQVTEGLDTTIATIAALGQPDETPSAAGADPERDDHRDVIVTAASGPELQGRRPARPRRRPT